MKKAFLQMRCFLKKIIWIIFFISLIHEPVWGFECKASTSESDIFNHLLTLLPPASPETISRLRELDPEILKGMDDNTEVVKVSYEAYRWALDCLIEKGFGSLDFFA